MNRRILLACALLFSVCIPRTCRQVRGDDVPRQTWDSIARYPGKGLSPLYDAAAKELQRILAGHARWCALPRPINFVIAQPDRPPCFEMHNGDTYYNNLYGNAEAIRWAAEQEWKGEFRLLYNSALQAHDDNGLWLTADEHASILKSFLNGKWRTCRPLGSSRFSRTQRGTQRLASAETSGWWLAGSSGLFHVQNGTLRRERIAGWPDVGANGVVSDREGRVVAWSLPDSERRVTVAIRNKGLWSTVSLPAGVWKSAAIRPDGVAVLAAGRRLEFIAAPGSHVRTPFTLRGTDEDQVLRTEGQLPLDDDWVRAQGTFALAPQGDLLFVAIRESDRSLGLVRVPRSGDAEWIEYPEIGRHQLISMPGGDFLIFTPGQGLFRLADDATQPMRVAVQGEVKPDDSLLGCDHRGRVYLKRGRAMLVFRPDARMTPTSTVHSHAELPAVSQRTRTGYSAAVDSHGRMWAVGVNGSVNMLKPGQGPELVDDRLIGAESIWPGRAGTMLVRNKDSSYSLTMNDGEITSAESLQELATDSFAEMLAAAPTQSRDTRVDLRPTAPTRFLAAPWLTIGETLWVTDSKEVHRMRSRGEKIEVTHVAKGRFKLMGPLRSGQLILSDESSSRITTWYKVDDPSHEMVTGRIGSPPAKQGSSGTLSRPESFGDTWYLDSQGWLWLHQGFDRVYHIESADEWSMLKDFGRPEFEHPAGTVWARHSSRVFPGYEVAGTTARRSCQPMYLQHLTPLVMDGSEILCLTPTGLAWLHFDRETIAGDRVTRTMPVDWGGEPTALIELHEDTLWVVVTTDSSSKLVSVNLQDQ